MFFQPPQTLVAASVQRGQLMLVLSLFSFGLDAMLADAGWFGRRGVGGRERGSCVVA
jgi:hypothetical protein